MFRYYRSLGWSCVPALLGEKRPKGQWKKYEKELPSEADIEKWSKEAEDGLGGRPQIGIITGSVSNIVVLDVDGAEGWKWLSEHKCHMPETPQAVTSPEIDGKPYTDKRHFYFKHPGDICENKVKFRPGLDLRGDGGFVMAPPSRHKDNTHRYEWAPGLDPKTIPVAEMPDWLRKELNLRVVVRVHDGDLLPPETDLAFEGVEKGRRNDMAARLAGKWFATGLGDAEVLALLLSWNLKNIPPLPEKELTKVWESISSREARNRTARMRSGETQETAPWHEERQGILRGLSAKLGTKIENIEKITGTDPVWYLYFEHGAYVSLSSDQIFSNVKFRVKVWAQTGVMLQPISNKKGEWERICQEISNAAEWKEGSDESTILGATRYAIGDYLAAFRPEIWESTAMRPPINYPFIYEGEGFIFSPHLLNYLQNNKGMKITIQQLSQRLVALKFKQFKNPKKISGFAVRVWGIPNEFMPPAPQQDAAEGKVVPIKRF